MRGFDSPPCHTKRRIYKIGKNGEPILLDNKKNTQHWIFSHTLVEKWLLLTIRNLLHKRPQINRYKLITQNAHQFVFALSDGRITACWTSHSVTLLKIYNSGNIMIRGRFDTNWHLPTRTKTLCDILKNLLRTIDSAMTLRGVSLY